MMRNDPIKHVLISPASPRVIGERALRSYGTRNL
jgi:hypothetical protein